MATQSSDLFVDVAPVREDRDLANEIVGLNFGASFPEQIANPFEDFVPVGRDHFRTVLGDGVEVLGDDLAVLSQVVSHRVAFETSKLVQLLQCGRDRFLDERPLLFDVDG